jgi:hypothetical protein
MLAGEDVESCNASQYLGYAIAYFREHLKMIVLDVLIVGSAARQINVVYIHIAACRPVAK